jgi:hypothetical protein
MALFFPNSMYQILYPMFARNDDPELADIKSTLLRIVAELRSGGDKMPHLHGLRNQLTDKIRNSTQKLAFQPENEQGYVFYFLQEFLRMFKIDATRGRPTPSQPRRRVYVMEIERCQHEPLTACLERNYRKWHFEKDTLQYMIIELIDYNVEAEETISFQDKDWELTAMIVFDCSHFVSYLKKNDGWFLYDDNRSLMQSPLKPYEFGKHYQRGFCKFQYGKKNTFFFYVPRGGGSDATDTPA